MTTKTDEELQDPTAWDWEGAESRPGRKPQSTTTASSAEALKYVEIPDTWLHCAVCGIATNRLDYTRNTCSQECARTAAIVEAINGWRIAGLPTWTLDTGAKSTVSNERPPYDAEGPMSSSLPRDLPHE